MTGIEVAACRHQIEQKAVNMKQGEPATDPEPLQTSWKRVITICYIVKKQ